MEKRKNYQLIFIPELAMPHQLLITALQDVQKAMKELYHIMRGQDVLGIALIDQADLCIDCHRPGETIEIACKLRGDGTALSLPDDTSASNAAYHHLGFDFKDWERYDSDQHYILRSALDRFVDLLKDRFSQLSQQA